MQAQDKTPKLRLEQVTKTYDGQGQSTQVLHSVSFEVCVGEIVMLVGPSGCGKSTLLNIIAGLDHATSGAVTLDEKPVRGPGPDRSLVFQDGALFPWLTAIGNIEFGLNQKALPPAHRKSSAHHYLSLVGLEAYADFPIHRLSGGMRQRIAIARSLALEPQVLLLDEPFASLDALTREDLYAEMQELWSKLGTTVVFVTHNVREASTLGDRVFLLGSHPGRILQEFPVELPSPRRIDDVRVIECAHVISEALKESRSGGNPPTP